MQYMRKMEIAPGRFILYNDTFFVKQCDEKIVWTSARQDAMVFYNGEADDALERNNRFLGSKG